MMRCRFVAVALAAALLTSCRSDDNRIRVACVGDSITLGGSEDNSDNYPSALQRLLGDGYRVRNFGVNGTTAGRETDQPYLLESALGRAKDFKPNTVVLMFGTNDTKIQNWHRGERFV